MQKVSVSVVYENIFMYNRIYNHILHYSGTKGRNKGEFTNLQGVAASSNGRILIADSNNQCVQVWPSKSCRVHIKTPNLY